MVTLSNREAQGRTPHDGRDAAEGEHHHRRANSSVSAGTGDARTGADKSKLHGQTQAKGRLRPIFFRSGRGVGALGWVWVRRIQGCAGDGHPFLFLEVGDGKRGKM